MPLASDKIEIVRYNTENVRSKERQNHPIVILLGWLGAEAKHLRKYAEIYQKNGCSTIMAASTPFDIMMGNDSSLVSLAKRVCLEAFRILTDLEYGIEGDEENKGLETTPTTPVMVHSFSNGGTYVMKGIHFAYDEITKKKKSSKELLTSDEENFSLVVDRLYNSGAVIYDSSPAFVNESVSKTAINSAYPNGPIRWILHGLMSVWFKLDALRSNVTGTETRAECFWRFMMECKLCMREGYVYGTADQIAMAENIDKLIDYRRNNVDVHISTLRFTDTGHLAHLLSHREEYTDFIIKMLNSILAHA